MNSRPFKPYKVHIHSHCQLIRFLYNFIATHAVSYIKIINAFAHCYKFRNKSFKEYNIVLIALEVKVHVFDSSTFVALFIIIGPTAVTIVDYGPNSH